MGKIYAVTSVFSTPDLLPHFCDHYAKLEVDAILVAMNVEYDTTHLQLLFPKLMILRTSYPSFSNAYKHEGELKLIDMAGAAPDDWMLHLDLDEFHQYPCHIRDVCDVAESRNMWAIRGCFVDRVASDGVLHPVRAVVPLDEQYPVSADLTGPMTGGVTHKVMLARRKIRLGNGRHHAIDAHTDRWPVGNFGHYKAHHFRWTSQLIERLITRWKPEEQKRCHWVKGNLSFVDRYKRLGRIDLDDPRYHARIEEGMTYPQRATSLQMLLKCRDSWGLDATELEQLADIVGKRLIRTVLEFGPGVSSVALAACGCQVVSLEADATCVDTISQACNHSLIAIYCYNPGYPINPPIPDREYDLGLIDGPKGSGYSFISRLDSAQYAMSRCRLLLIHDAKRKGEHNLVRYLLQVGWQTDIEFKSRRGLVLLKRNDSDRMPSPSHCIDSDTRVAS